MSVKFSISKNSDKKAILNNPKLYEKLKEGFNVRLFRPKDTGLTARQVNHLNKSVLDDKRENKRSWRKFSLKDLIYLSIVQELRNFGINDDEIQNLKKSFFSDRYEKSVIVCIIAVLSGVKIHLIVYNNFNIEFFDTVQFNINPPREANSYIDINLNNISNNVMKGLKLRKEADYDDIITLAKGEMVSGEDKEMIDLINNDNYKNLKIRKNNDCFVISAEREEEISDEDLLKVIEKKDFGNFEIIKRDGKIVKIKVEDIRKIKKHT